MDIKTLIITLRKTVPSEAAAQVILELVKTRLADHPEVQITGHVTTHFGVDETPAY